MKNRIALKLTLYFTAVLLVFAIIIGGVFYQFFRQHTVDLKRQEMNVRAERIAEVISDNMNFLEKRYGSGIANSRFISYLDNVSSEIVWVVDSDRNLSLNMDAINKHRAKMGRRRMAAPPHHATAVKSRDSYEKMPPHVREKIEQCFEGQSFAIEEYNYMLDDITLTVGKPVYNDGQVKAVVLLHSPVQGLDEAVWAGLRILLISLVAAMVLGLLLSVVMSWRFTKSMNIMKNIAERLAERDYSARSNIVQNDEVGDLAKTLDVLAERLQLADEESQKLEKLRRQFIANISHELRTPVTVIRGSLEALRDGVITEQEDVQEFHDQMYKESLFLQRLINDLLDLSRLQNTDFPIEMERVNFCEVVQDAVRSGRRLGQERNIQVNAAMDREIYPLLGDYGRLRQLLMIFVHNSIKFSKEGGSVELVLKGNCLQVKDHGCGIKAEDVEHAFERFYKAHNEQNKTGSGLGLAIAKQIAERHSMDLQLESVEGEGTIITVLLPQPMAVEHSEDDEAEGEKHE